MVHDPRIVTSADIDPQIPLQHGREGESFPRDILSGA